METKEILCHFCNSKMTVNKYSSLIQSCPNCINKGLKIKDKRSSKETLEKREKTNLEKFGVKYPSKSEEIKNKTKATNLEKRGVPWGFYDNKIQIKIKKTNLKKYGYENPASSEAIKQKIRKKQIIKRSSHAKNNLRKYLNLELLTNYYNQNEKAKFKCLICNHIFEETYFNVCQRLYPCPNCRPKNYSISEYENKIFNFLSKYFDDIILNDRKTISPKELDIFIPSLNIAIEINGVYWHSNIFIENKFYHLNKLEKCQENNIRLIHIFEDEIFFKFDIVKSRLKQILKLNNGKRIHARKCIIKEIDSKMKNEFLEKYHIQGKDNSSIKLGAFYEKELISVMTFSKGNIAKGSKSIEGVWELNRFCSNYNYHIPGIASKLLTYFRRNYKWKEIFSYADRRWSEGNVYEKIGFEYVGNTSINYWYTRGNERIHRFKLRKRPNEPKNITERELRQNEGYNRIWDCGNLKYVMKNNS